MSSTIASANGTTAERRERHRTDVRAISISPELVTKLKLAFEIIGYTMGPALVAFNIFNFSVARLGYFYQDPARYGIAGGVLLICIAWLLRNHKISS